MLSTFSVKKRIVKILFVVLFMLFLGMIPGWSYFSAAVGGTCLAIIFVGAIQNRWLRGLSWIGFITFNFLVMNYSSMVLEAWLKLHTAMKILGDYLHYIIELVKTPGLFWDSVLLVFSGNPDGFDKVGCNIGFLMLLVATLIGAVMVMIFAPKTVTVVK